MTLNFVANRKIWFSVSAVLIAVSIASLAVWGLKFGVDFTGGSLMELSFGEAHSTAEVSSVLQETGFASATVQSVGENGALLRLPPLTEEEHQKILTSLKAKFSTDTGLTEQRFNSVGPVVGAELRKTAMTGVLLTLLLIGLYIAWAFRKVNDPVPGWKYAVLVVACAAHDVIVPLGAFAIFGHFYGWEVGSAFIAAALTILGYSISDTVVVFDRTRENLLRDPGAPFAETVEKSIQETFIRSINTSLTTLLALTAVFFFGGETTKPFALALIIGIAVGTYSSIFFASPALVAWDEWGKRKGIRQPPPSGGVPPRAG